MICAAHCGERAEDARAQAPGAAAEFEDLAAARAFEDLAALQRDAGAVERRDLRSGDEIAARAELRRAADVIAEPGRVERARHVLVEAQEAVVRSDRRAYRGLQAFRGRYLVGAGIG